MVLHPTPSARSPALLMACFFLAWAAAGCGGSTYPVAGRVLLDNKPLVARSAVVLFKPNAARGNQSSFEPAGQVDGDGNYTLLTNGKPGAPPGWYRVIVTALDEPPQHPRGPHREQRPVARSLMPARYGQAATTPLAVEVVESPDPGAYDLKLESQ